MQTKRGFGKEDTVSDETTGDRERVPDTTLFTEEEQRDEDLPLTDPGEVDHTQGDNTDDVIEPAGSQAESHATNDGP